MWAESSRKVRNPNLGANGGGSVKMIEAWSVSLKRPKLFLGGERERRSVTLCCGEHQRDDRQVDAPQSIENTILLSNCAQSSFLFVSFCRLPFDLYS